MCTSDGRALSNRVEFDVLGPRTLSVADAEVREAANATLDFVVRISPSPSGTVTVDYATSDGTATAGSDYTAASGTLTIAPGEAAQTVSVAVFDDGHNEGEETMTLTLTNVSGAYLLDGEATGTIENDDPMPAAWLARFGRTVASHAVDAIAGRMEGGGGSHVRVGGGVARPVRDAGGGAAERRRRTPARGAERGGAGRVRRAVADNDGARAAARELVPAQRRRRGRRTGRDRLGAVRDRRVRCGRGRCAHGRCGDERIPRGGLRGRGAGSRGLRSR